MRSNCYRLIDAALGLGLSAVLWIPPALSGQSAGAATQITSWGFYSCPCPGNITTNVPPNLTNVLSIAGRQMHAIALRTDGTVASWGWDNYGVTSVPGDLSNVVQVAAGFTFSLALKSDGTVTSWGNTDSPQSAGRTPSGLSNVVKIAAGDYHALALRADGSLVPWGSTNFGLAQIPAGLTNIARIACGANESMVIRTDGSLVVWGKLASLGIPQDVTNVVAVDSATDTLVALKADGTIRAWGGAAKFTQVPSEATNIVAIAANVQGADIWTGRFLALRADGRVFSWGSVRTPVPANLPFVSQIVAVQSDLALVDPNRATTPPIILGSPSSQTVSVGASVSLIGNAFGYGTLNYQWFFNGTNAIFGATNSFLHLNSVQTHQSGTYTFTVSNNAGISVSQPATLSILPGLQIQMAPVIYLYGTIGANYRLDYVNLVAELGPWNEVATITLTNNPHLFVDFSAIGQPRRFYRTMQIP